MIPQLTPEQHAKASPLERRRIQQARLDDVIRYASPWRIPDHYDVSFEEIRECFGTGIAGPWAAREGGKANTPLTLPGNSTLEYWVTPSAGVTQGSQALAVGGGPVAPTLSGTGLTQSFAIDMPISVAGALGTAKFDVFVNGGPQAAGILTTGGAGVAIPGLNINSVWGVGAYTLAHNYRTVQAQWADQSGLGRLFLAPASVTTRPVIKGLARAGRPAIETDGSGGKLLKDATSNVASNLGTGTAKDRTIFVVQRSTTTTPTSTNTIIALSNSVGSAVWKICQRNTSNDYALIAVDNAGNPASILHGPSNNSLTLNYKILVATVSGTSVLLEDEDGNVLVSGTQSVGAQTFDTLTFLSDASGHDFIGEMAESMGYSSALDPTTRGILRTYLRAGWGF